MVCYLCMLLVYTLHQLYVAAWMASMLIYVYIYLSIHVCYHRSPSQSVMYKTTKHCDIMIFYPLRAAIGISAFQLLAIHNNRIHYIPFNTSRHAPKFFRILSRPLFMQLSLSQSVMLLAVTLRLTPSCNSD